LPQINFLWSLIYLELPTLTQTNFTNFILAKFIVIDSLFVPKMTKLRVYYIDGTPVLINK